MLICMLSFEMTLLLNGSKFPEFRTTSKDEFFSSCFELTSWFHPKLSYFFVLVTAKGLFWIYYEITDDTHAFVVAKLCLL